MLYGKKIVVVLPAFRAAATLEKTFREIPMDTVDEVFLVDDCSDDQTIDVAQKLGIKAAVHLKNRGYGGNQKTCYQLALRHGADVVVMLHPDYQYDPRLVTPMAGMVASGVYDVVMGSRILGGTALSGGMPKWKYVANRMLTAYQNAMTGLKLSEFHTGYRAYSRKVLESLALNANSDDFVFDNQLIAQCAALGFRIGEISCPTKYFPEASSINFRRSVKYGLGVVSTNFYYRMWKMGIVNPLMFQKTKEFRLPITHPPAARLTFTEHLASA